MTRCKRKAPISLVRNTTNLQWHKYYVTRYNADPTNTDACILAMYYLFNHLAEQDKTSTTKPDLFWEDD